MTRATGSPLGRATAILSASMASCAAPAAVPSAATHAAPPAPASVSGDPVRMNGTGPVPPADRTSILAGFALRSASLTVTGALVPGASAPPPPPPPAPSRGPMPRDAVVGPVRADTALSLYSNTAAVPRGAPRGTHTVDSSDESWLTNTPDDLRVSLTVTRASWPPPSPPPPSGAILE